jgi:hypothetical protein
MNVFESAYELYKSNDVCRHTTIHMFLGVLRFFIILFEDE